MNVGQDETMGQISTPAVKLREPSGQQVPAEWRQAPSLLAARKSSRRRTRDHGIADKKRRQSTTAASNATEQR
jgi:hypothetical protein